MSIKWPLTTSDRCAPLQADELAAHETTNTGCMHNYHYLWSQSQGTCELGQVYTLQLQSLWRTPAAAVS